MAHDAIDEPQVAAATRGPRIFRRKPVEPLGLNAALKRLQ
jgi:hypothetical protein